MKRLGRAFLMLTAVLRLLATEATNHWSLLPIVRPALPSGAPSARNPIDQFIQAKLVVARLAPAELLQLAVFAAPTVVMALAHVELIGLRLARHAPSDAR